MGDKKRYDGRWERRFTIDGVRYSVCGQTKKELDEKEHKKRNALEAHYIDNSSITLEKYYEEWQSNRAGVVKPSTIYVQNTRFKHVKKALGKKKLRKLEPREIKQFRNSLKGKLTTQGINDIMSLLKAVLETAVNDRIIPYNPANGIRALKRTEKKTTDTIHRALTPKEQELFLKYSEDSFYGNYFRFLLATGMRPGEAAALEWSDIDEKNSTISITKTAARVSNKKVVIQSCKTKSSERTIPLTNSAKVILRRQKAQTEKLFPKSEILPRIRVFTTTNGKDIVTAGNTSNAIKVILDRIEKGEKKNKVKIERFSSHAFRDTFATNAIRAGMTPNTLKNWLGHANLSITMDLYAQTLPEDMSREAEKLRDIV